MYNNDFNMCKLEYKFCKNATRIYIVYKSFGILFGIKLTLMLTHSEWLLMVTRPFLIQTMVYIAWYFPEGD